MKRKSPRPGKYRRPSPTNTKATNIKTRLNQGINLVLKALNSFSKGMNSIHFNYDAGDRRFNHLSKSLNRASGVNHDFSVLTGHQQPTNPRL